MSIRAYVKARSLNVKAKALKPRLRPSKSQGQKIVLKATAKD